MTLPTLYKKSKKAIEQWTISVGEDEKGAYFEVEYGQLNGVMQYKRNYTKGKNIGRANETTPLEQAKLEAQSRFNKQKDKQYNEDINAEPALLPMLALEYAKYGHRLSFPAYIQPKLDGIRCLTYMEDGIIVMRSRNNKDLFLPHLQSDLEDFFKKHPEVILDGELYEHSLNFQEIVSLTTKDQGDTSKIEYHVYDTVSDSKFSIRNLSAQLVQGYNKLKYVETRVVSSHHEIARLHTYFTDKGYEGSIIRNDGDGYSPNKRSLDLLKNKDFITEEFEIIGAEENLQKPGTCTMTLKTKEGYEFSAMPEGSLEHREKLWQDRESLIGQMMSVRFFSWTNSERSVPRFPIGVVVRNYE